MELTVEGSAEAEPCSAAKASSRRPVDLVHLARYTLGNRALEREVLELFRRQSRLYLDRLAKAESDKAWRDAAHTIKGSARGIGAWRVADLAEGAERLAGEVLAQERDRALARLSEAIGETNAYIERLLLDA